HRIGTGRPRGTRGDTNRGSGHQCCGVHVARADFFGDAQGEFVVGASASKVFGTHRVAVAGRKVSDRKIEGSFNVLGKNAGHCVREVHVQWWLLGYG
ncbi:hypothetical protein QP246_10670, partial [Aerococcus urinae]|nr:hypothetical protein [Aerococcus urinae]